MRLTCPNCDAQYEVPENVMPPEGRDVQCSNCGTTWFQKHPDELARLAAETPPDIQEDEEVARSDDAVEDTDTDNSFDPPPEVMPAPKASDGAAAPARRELDPAVADVLRAEAELEEQARRNEMAAMESQPELGLESAEADAKQRAREARERMARMRGEPVAEEQGHGEMPANEGLGSRRDLLPDIEEINSTLRSNSDRSPATDPGQTAQIEVQEKRSSRRGFTLTVLLVAILAVIYVFEQQLSGAIPQAGGILDAYVTMVDGWRAWLDAQVVSILSWLDDAAASSNAQK